MHQGNALLQIVAVKSGEHPHFYHELETVADPEDQLAILDKAAELLDELFAAAADSRVSEAVCLGLGAAEIVAVKESAGQIEKVEVVKAGLTGEDVRNMGYDRLVKTAETAGMSRLHFAVGAVAGDY